VSPPFLIQKGDQQMLGFQLLLLVPPGHILGLDNGAPSFFGKLVGIGGLHRSSAELCYSV